MRGVRLLLLIGAPVAMLLLVLLIARPASPAVAPAPAPAADSVLGGETVRLLIVGDPFANALQQAAGELGRRAGGTIDIEVVGYDDLRAITLRNAGDTASAFDIVSFDVLWAGEYGAAEVLLPLDDLIAATPALDPDDFLPIAYRASRHAGRQLGLPIQPHPELLWYRRDRLAAAGLAPPATTAELLAAARALQRPEQGQHGVCWNGQRGQPLGQQMAHFYAAFGQPLLGPDGRPTLDTPRGVAAARFARDLLAVSPPDVLTMAWDQRVRRFGSGGCLFAYEWAARTFMVEEDVTSAARDHVGYAAPPHASGAAPVTPMGAWSLGIPANIGERRELAWRFLAWLSSQEQGRSLAIYGNGGMPRLSLLRDPELAARYPTFPLVSRLSAEGQLADWMRPPVPEWNELADVLGTVYHDMLRGELTPEQAAALAQRRADALFAQQ